MPDRFGVARMMDANGDHRLSAAEYVETAVRILRNEGLSALAQCRTGETATIAFSPEEARRRFSQFRQQNTDLFANGIEVPTEVQFHRISTSSVTQQRLADTCATEASAFDRFLAGVRVSVDRIRLSGEYSAASPPLHNRQPMPIERH
ncbi:hypothetical protein [Brevundimonas sp.]|uniref:hypothetical protein n=1 Tax=Brevundimonas sp. TaxID=1871086 RepID=UPI003BA8E168